MSQNLDLAKDIIKKKTKIRCTACNGYGMVKTELQICSVCDGIKCVMCNSTGFSVMPYSDCLACDLRGEIEIEIEE